MHMEHQPLIHSGHGLFHFPIEPKILSSDWNNINGTLCPVNKHDRIIRPNVHNINEHELFSILTARRAIIKSKTSCLGSIFQRQKSIDSSLDTRVIRNLNTDMHLYHEHAGETYDK